MKKFKACIFITIVCLAIMSGLNAQTKKIYHKSHSGSSSTFQTSLKHAIFETEGSNFGNPPITFVEVDSVIKVSKNTVEYARKLSDKSKQKKDNKVIRDPFFIADTTLSRMKSATELLKYIENKYDFAVITPIDKIVFVNFAFSKAEAKKSQPGKKTNSKK